MTAQQAYLSWANHIKSQLQGSGINVYLYGSVPEVLQYPYLLLQDGPEEIEREWLASILCQGRLVVERVSTEDFAATIGRALNKVLDATRDQGHLPKYDYDQDPPVAIGTYIPKFFGDIHASGSSDRNRESRVVTWDLYTSYA